MKFVSHSQLNLNTRGGGGIEILPLQQARPKHFLCIPKIFGLTYRTKTNIGNFEVTAPPPPPPITLRIVFFFFFSMKWIFLGREVVFFLDIFGGLIKMCYFWCLIGVWVYRVVHQTKYFGVQSRCWSKPMHRQNLIIPRGVEIKLAV